MKAAFVKTLNQFVGYGDEAIANANTAREIICDTAGLQEKLAGIENEIHLLEGTAQSLAEKNASTAMDQDEFQKQYGDLEERYRAAEREHEKISGQSEEKEHWNNELDGIIRSLEAAFGMVTEFSERQWGEFADHTTVIPIPMSG